MTTIVYAQPVFLPDEKRFNRNLDSVRSFFDYIKTNGNDGLNVSIIMGGWAKTDELWNKFIEECKKINTSIAPIRFPNNVGKAVIVNSLMRIVSDKKLDYQYILTADSDILFPTSSRNMFKRLVNIAVKSVEKKKKPFGMISLKQDGQNCHYKTVYQNRLNLPFENITEEIVWPNSPSGIAGGCLFLSRELWENVGGYKVFGVYTGEDAFLLQMCGQRGFSYQVSETVAIIHPMDDDVEYSKWKHKVCQSDFATGIKTDISESVKRAEEFWENRS